MKDLTKYELEDEIIQKFRDGAIAERKWINVKTVASLKIDLTIWIHS